MDKATQSNEEFLLQAQINALYKSQAVIEFTLDGTIEWANENFLSTMGYTLEEIKGKHHRIFADPAYARSAEYRQFWAQLGAGEFASGEYKRFGKGGKEVWIQASYNPILDANDKPFKVVKFATDITEAKLKAAYDKGKIKAIGRSQAVIEFTLDGTIEWANENFLSTMGYTLEEIKGKHHRIFADPAYARSAEYRQFWAQLGAGEFASGEYKRFGKGGKEVWIQASYNPIFDANDKPFKVVKFATDITEAKLKAAYNKGKIKAIGRSQAVIEFTLDGTIEWANENFLSTMGYTLEEIKGKHHRIFADPAYARSAEYRQFWAQLGAGEFASGEYKRFGKGGKEVWIQASYNPIFDANDKPFKVVKFATDITEAKLKAAYNKGKIKAIGRSQAVIEFTLDGTIEWANENFLSTMGYTLEEIKGKHHRIFADPAYARSAEYRQFWAQLGAGEFASGEYKRFGKGGKEVWIQASYNPIFDANDKPFKVVKFATDITEDVNNRHTFRLLSLVANETDNSVVITDPEGRIIFTNPGFTKLTGYKNDEVLGKKPGAVLQGKNTDPQTKQRIRQKLNNRESFYEEILNYDKLGNPYWISLAINPVFDDNGKLEHFISIQTNITSTKMAAIETNIILKGIGESTAVLEWSPEGALIHSNAYFDNLLNSSNERDTKALVKNLKNHMSSSEFTKASLGNTVATNLSFKGNDNLSSLIEAIVTPIFDADRNLLKLISFGPDISERQTLIDNTREAMTKILNRISGIVGSINKISEQTKLISLNARIESARAGEAGKAFVVVSSEVSNLAQDAARAADKINHLIHDSQQLVDEL